MTPLFKFDNCVAHGKGIDFDYVCYDDTTKVTIIFQYFFPYPSHQFVFHVRIMPLVHRVIVKGTASPK